MALITLLRHAPLAKEYQKRYIGHTNIEIDLKLTDLSLFKDLKLKDYDLVFSSDLKRCTQTLELLEFDFQIDSRLREVEFKDSFELKSFDEIEKMDIYDKKYLDSFLSWHDFICKESFSKFEQRVYSFIKELPKNKNILICSHGGTIKMMNSILNNEEYISSPFNLKYLESVDIIISQSY
ncbi:hypothetical protein CRV08_00850 [Halarcobacter ebronensis]|uniref:Phosphoglycerate mutase n=1 Tax=Halarcobacter ebronensis TaxID=1462615 RepID=A0A4Q0YIM3_9BACT|nr:histidine phosphatase family protein [Halarcobacter ebronensis]RXJ70145.1 hypothetical protein CRV08_00850 [Halarcobacter ebronensis]